MYSKEEAKIIKQEFWTTFAKEFPVKWILFNTRIKDFALKFEIDHKKARVGIEISNSNEALQLIYFQKIESLKTILEDDYLKNCIFDQYYTLETGKKVGKIYVELDNISINNKNNWHQIFNFFNDNMIHFENFFIEHEDYIRDLSWNS